MKKLGAYISPRADTASSSPYFTKGCFVYYEYVTDRKFNNEVSIFINIWRLDAKLNQNPDEIIVLRSPDDVRKHIEPNEKWFNHNIVYRDRLYRIKNMECRLTRFPDIEIIDELTVESIDHYAGETWRHDGSSVYQFLKEAKLVDLKTKVDYVRTRPITAFNDLTMPDELTGDQYKPWCTAIDNMIKEELKKSLEQYVMKSALNSCYGMGGFTTNPNPFKVAKIAEKETKTMEKKKMTQTDLFLKDIDNITITSTYSKLDFGCGKPYYIYYPEMEITEDIADTLLTVLLMARKDFIHKVVFNPEKGTTALSKNWGKEMVTVRCKDGEFDYILGYEMARSKRYIGADDYNWFNKIKNHRKTHIEYTEKKPTKKGGKK